MDTRNIDKLMWKALFDGEFRERLLNGQRHQILATFDLRLTDAEMQNVLAIQANTLDVFAGELCQLGLVG